MTEIDRALVVDDLAASRDWLGRALALAFPGIAVVYAATLAEGLVRAEPAPPLALIDLGLPDGPGLRLVEHLAARSLCVVATVFDDDAHLFPALRAGAQGYVLKDQPPEVLAEMLRGIVAGQPPLSPSIARRLLRHFQPPANAAPEAPTLAPREIDVLRIVAKGYTLAEVAESLGITRHTASGYLKDVYRKLGVSSRAEATLAATRMGLVTPRAD